MQLLSPHERPGAVVAIMGATGTGKSTFINLLTNDDKIRIGHNQQSETFGIQTAQYIDPKTGRSVTLIDTPGFDDSREGVTDTDILEKIVQFLEPGGGQRVNVNGIIYMHRISDPRVSGTSRKNIKMFHSLCGEASLGNVRIVTTNWGRVTEQEGNDREADLKSGAFKALIGAGAQMHRHANTVESAREIISELILLEAVAMKIQEELRAGKKLADTAAGMVLAAEMMEARKKNELELADLTRELNSAEENNNLVLRAELEQERRVLEEQMARANADRKRLEATLDAVGVSSAGRHRRSESFPQLGEKRKEALEVPGSLQSPSGDLMSSERQPSVRSSGRSESKRRATEYPSRELDMTRGDEKTSFQLLQEELDKMRQMRLQQLELDTERMRASQEEEFRLRQQEIHLQDLRAQIRAAERKEDERSQASMSRKVVNGIAYVAHKLSGW